MVKNLTLRVNIVSVICFHLRWRLSACCDTEGFLLHLESLVDLTEAQTSVLLVRHVEVYLQLHGAMIKQAQQLALLSKYTHVKKLSSNLQMKLSQL